MSDEFRPLPLLGNPHLQTLIGSMLPGAVLPAPIAVHPVELPDGDRLVLHDNAPARWQPGRPIALLLHGLGGDHRSTHGTRLARALLRRGLRVVRADLRGCGRGLALARRPYHAGCSDDIRAALGLMHRWSPESPLFLIGFSMGGNVALKLAGEARTAPVAGLARVVAVGPPIDLQRCADLISQPRNRLYEVHFLRELLRLYQRRHHFFPTMPRIRFPQPLNLPLYDDLYTAREWGFSGVHDYYRRASSLELIPQIEVPTLILTARDDPFIAVGPFESLPAGRPVEVRILERGGHLGFLGWDGLGGVRWVEKRICDWLALDGPRRTGAP